MLDQKNVITVKSVFAENEISFGDKIKDLLKNKEIINNVVLSTKSKKNKSVNLK
ncbi:hypothetical protein AGMMS50284_4900 [Clostridia bacterium]|nr:hypothetical protein AGMMS50284_4900 [Clostridia bacterium]